MNLLALRALPLQSQAEVRLGELHQIGDQLVAVAISRLHRGDVIKTVLQVT